MGINGNNPKSGKKARKFQPSAGTDGIADWKSASGEAVLDAIESVARTGGAVRFGYTRDGGAYAIGVYGDGEPYTVYVRPHEDLDKILREMAETFRE